MGLSLSMMRHRLAEARGAQAAMSDLPPRPEGRVVWVQTSSAPRGMALLLEELVDRHPDVTVIASGATEGMPQGVLSCPAPRDTGADMRRYLDHIRPDIAVYAGTRPYPLIWSEAAARGIRQVALDADPVLHPLSLVRPLSHFAFTAFRRSDPRLARGCDAIGALNDVTAPPPVARGEVEAMAARVATRPVWMAAGVPPSEVDDVLAAHDLAAQLSHRLLLVLEPADPAEGAALRERLLQAGWPCLRRADGDEPASETRVVIADAAEETGLWLRLASITYVGGTLSGRGVGCPPLVPAALGSVVLHGSHLGVAAADLGRLHAGNAAWRVTSGEELGRAVERFLAPDRAAEMAQAGWAVTSHGADVSAMALDALDGLLTALDAP